MKAFTTQASSVFANSHPNFAIDGVVHNTTNIFQSQVENYPWLEIKLPSPIWVYNVTIVHRKDCCGEDLDSVEIRVGQNPVPCAKSLPVLCTGFELSEENLKAPENSICGNFEGPGSNGGSDTIICQEKLYGQYVTLQRTSNSSALFLNEVIIAGSKKWFPF